MGAGDWTMPMSVPKRDIPVRGQDIRMSALWVHARPPDSGDDHSMEVRCIAQAVIQPTWCVSSS
eukprot:scaffold312846_cov30-Tisochrysis_lutea.AAC.1